VVQVVRKECQQINALEGFMAQFAIHGDLAIQAAWTAARLRDDPMKQSNKRGDVTFATAGPNARTTQIFINYCDNGSTRLAGIRAVW
jgi:hypothetical protein